MEKKIAPSEHKAQALQALLQGQAQGQSGEELLSLLVRLATERILQEALEQEQAAALGRGRYEARGRDWRDGTVGVPLVGVSHAAIDIRWCGTKS